MDTVMASQNTPPNEDEVLAYVHQKRLAVVENITSKGIPTDVDNVKLLLTALKDMDGQAIGRKRIKSEERNSDLNAQSAALIAKLLTTANFNLPRTNTLKDLNAVPVLPDTIKPPVLVHGEIDIVTTDIGYEEFINNFVESD